MSEIKVRPANSDDQQFLKEVYFSSRADELAAFGWDDAQKTLFLEMQFQVRQQAYKMQYPNAEYYLVLVSENKAGSLIIDRSGNAIWLTDIAILPGYRGGGVATSVIKDLQSEAAASLKPVILHVDRNNGPAKRLYDRLGFVVTSEGELSDEMEWNPTG